MRPSFWHILVVVLIIAIVFGASKLPDIARNLGKSAKILKEEMKDLQSDAAPAALPTSGAPAPATPVAGVPVQQPAPQPASPVQPATPAQPVQYAAPQQRPAQSAPATNTAPTPQPTPPASSSTAPQETAVQAPVTPQDAAPTQSDPNQRN
ncbi:twin-arginine translocase TatA/TatE family subunit [Neoactinobaculum massilliense]|uniref:twin-arginine translocase TatA/TatE family subunit n=1 Tax=Neoactinobaculum massilliense TaxID=2364794 RepID=UPI0013DE5509|nr:twin-arginine translocase TatA/TatE family subunit [Neoactinobaculum massilliense]